MSSTHPETERRIAPFELIIFGQEILDIRNIDDIRLAVETAKCGVPISFNGGGVYGLGGLAEAFTDSYNGIPSIAEMKGGRDFFSNPPIALPSWPMLKSLVDWDKISGHNIGFNQEGVQAFVRSIYDTLPLHLVLPIRPESSKMLPFALTRDDTDVLCHGFMCSGAVVPLQSLINQFEQVTNGVLLATSANPRGTESFTTYQQVAQTFPKIPFILKDPQTKETTAEDNKLSYTMYDLFNFPRLIEFLRGGNVSHDLLAKMMLEAGFRPNLAFPNVKILTDQPSITVFQS